MAKKATVAERKNKPLWDLAIILMGEGRVDEGMALEDLLRECERASTLTGPVCPTCLQAMVRTTYEGYYDGFSYWACQCGDEVTGIKWRGGYA